MRTYMIAGFILAWCCQCVAQPGYFGYWPDQNRPFPKVPHAIRLEIAGIDSEAAAFGFKVSDLTDALRMSAEAAGWDVEAGSEFVLVASLVVAPQRQEDMTTFQLTVSGGTEAPQTAGITGGFRTDAMVDLPQGESAKLYAQLTQMATKAAQRFRQDLTRRAFQMRVPKGRRYIGDWPPNPSREAPENQ